MVDTFQKDQWYVNPAGLRLWEENMDGLIINTIEELEELYTRHVINYNDYLNFKYKLEKKKYIYSFHGKEYIVSFTDEEKEKFERIYKTTLIMVEEENE